MNYFNVQISTSSLAQSEVGTRSATSLPEQELPEPNYFGALFFECFRLFFGRLYDPSLLEVGVATTFVYYGSSVLSSGNRTTN